MVKLLIVDDEQNTREGLLRFLPWNELGIDQVFEAEDGIEAWSIFEKENPGIILCDVRMPRMNGIELSEKIRQNNSHCKIIFLSGYSDKEYLKSAIKVGAIDYVEKPIILKELSAVISNAIQAYTADEGKKEQDTLLNENNIAQKLLDPKTDSIDIHKILEGRIVEVNNKLQLMISTVLLRWAVDTNKNVIMTKIMQNISNKAKDTTIDIIKYRPSESELVIISQFNKSCHESILSNVLKEALNEFSENSFQFSIGASKWYEGKGTVNYSYREALKAANMLFFMGYGKVIPYESIIKEQYVFNDNNYTEFERHLIENNEQDATSFVKKLTQQVSRYCGTDIYYIRHIFLNLYLLVYSISEKRNFQKSSDEHVKGPFWNKILELQTISEIENDLLKEVNSFFDAFKDKDSYEYKVKEIITFIYKNYSDSEITVTAISKNVHLSLNYMCGMFKKSTGKTINDFLREVRIENACKLLKIRDIKLYEIAGQVGFTGTNYFTRVFKKHLGMTPTAYREKYLL